MIGRVGIKQKEIIAKAIGVLQQGGIVAYPTEAIYGLGCDPFNQAAVMRLLALKQRSIDRGFILITSDWDNIKHLTQPVVMTQMKQIMETWPGPVTWVFPASEYAPKWICGVHHSIAIRIIKHPIARMLCEAFNGPLVSTSANRAAGNPAKTAAMVRTLFPRGIDLIMDGCVGNQLKPTEIRDALTGRVLRLGS